VIGKRSLTVLAVCAAAAFTAAGAVAAARANEPYAALLAPAGTCGAAEDKTDLDLASARTAMLCLTNYARTRHGLAPLRLNAVLHAAGQAKLTADVSCGEFSHTPCGHSFDTVFARYLARAASYRIGENIEWGTGSYGTPRQALNRWLRSPGHRANILSASYTELGIGYLSGQSFQDRTGVTLWSQEFGTRTPRLRANP
jgi:uncharacterized protein YkwD